MLTEKFLLHSRDLSIGIINPLELSSFIEIKREEPIVEEILSNLTKK